MPAPLGMHAEGPFMVPDGVEQEPGPVTGKLQDSLT